MMNYCVKTILTIIINDICILQKKRFIECLLATNIFKSSKIVVPLLYARKSTFKTAKRMALPNVVNGKVQPKFVRCN